VVTEALISDRRRDQHGARALRDECPSGVKTGNAQNEQMWSGLPPRAAMAKRFMSTRPRMFRLTLIHGSTSANFVALVDSGSSLLLASKARRVVEVANDAPILEM
jgi:hypothetical protein